MPHFIKRASSRSESLQAELNPSDNVPKIRKHNQRAPRVRKGAIDGTGIALPVNSSARDSFCRPAWSTARQDEAWQNSKALGTPFHSAASTPGSFVRGAAGIKTDRTTGRLPACSQARRTSCGAMCRIGYLTTLSILLSLSQQVCTVNDSTHSMGGCLM